MLEINLLPVREARRKADLRQQVMQLVLGLIVTFGVIGLVNSKVSDQKEMAQLRVRQMQQDIEQFQPQIEQVAAFKKKKSELEKKIDVIEGLDNVPGLPKGSYGVVTKIHHAAIDGVSGSELAAAIHDLEPGAPVPPPEKRWRPDPEPTFVELAGRTTWNNLRQPFRAARVLGETVPAVRRRVVDCPWWTRPSRSRLSSAAGTKASLTAVDCGRGLPARRPVRGKKKIPGRPGRADRGIGQSRHPSEVLRGFGHSSHRDRGGVS